MNRLTRNNPCLTFQLQLPNSKYVSSGQRAAFIQQLREELEALPGARSVAVTDHLPLTSYILMTRVSVAGEPRERFRKKPAASVASIGIYLELGVWCLVFGAWCLEPGV